MTKIKEQSLNDQVSSLKKHVKTKKKPLYTCT